MQEKTDLLMMAHLHPFKGTGRSARPYAADLSRQVIVAEATNSGRA